MVTPNPHTLNQRLAEIVGKEVEEFHAHGLGWEKTIWLITGERQEEWAPCHDPAQMEMLFHHIGSRSISLEFHHGMCRATVTNDHPRMDSANKWEARTRDWKLALAHAICAAIPKENP